MHFSNVPFCNLTFWFLLWKGRQALWGYQKEAAMPVVWPTLLDLSRDECKRILRKLGMIFISDVLCLSVMLFAFYLGHDCLHGCHISCCVRNPLEVYSSCFTLCYFLSA